GDPTYACGGGSTGAIKIGPATPTIRIAGSFTYDGTPHAAVISATGVNGTPVAGSLSVSYGPTGASSPINAGSYEVSVAFSSTDPKYVDTTASGVVGIAAGC